VSRWNPWWYELTKPFRRLFAIVISVMALGVWLALLLVYGEERASDIMERWLCRITSHRWADETKWGVESVCLKCGKERTES